MLIQLQLNDEQWIRQLNITINNKIEVMKDIIDFKTSKKKSIITF